MDKPKPREKPKPEALPLSELDKAMRGLVGVPKKELRAEEEKEKRDSHGKRPKDH